MSNLYSLATNPKQYDKVGDKWLLEGAQDTPWRSFFKQVLRQHLRSLKGKKVLDIGCGTGWVCDLVFELGAASYKGVEPSKCSFKVAQTNLAGQFINLPFEEFQTKETFDLITFIMSSEHIDDLSFALGRCFGLLKSKGRVVIISGDLPAYTMKKFGYRVITEQRSKNEAIVHTIRPGGVNTIDIIRSPEVYKIVAINAGFSEVDIYPLRASDELIRRAPKYELFRDKPIFQLMIFSNNSQNWGEL